MSTYRRILVPLDLSPAGEAKLGVAEAQARAFGAELILLHVLPEKAIELNGNVSRQEAVARAYLDAIAARLRAAGVPTQPLVRAGPVAATVLETAREQHPDLIIVGATVRAGLARLLPGGIADEIVHQAPSPVLLVRPALEGTLATPVVRSFADDAARTGAVAPRPLGTRTVELARIVGSVGRPDDLGADFRPLLWSAEDDQRYQRVFDAMERGLALPPADFYKLGYGYYVLDGHHRVAAARVLGQLWMDGIVTEYVPIADTAAQRVFAERRRFEQTTGLTRVGVARAGNYARLEAQIRSYAEQHELDDLHEAARRWYAEVFRPLQVQLRARRLGQHFPGERTADIFLRLVDYRQAEAARQGHEPSWEDALRSFAAGQLAAARER